METVTIPKQEFDQLRKRAAKAEVDEELLKELVQGLKEIKDKKIKRVK